MISCLRLIAIVAILPHFMFGHALHAMGGHAHACMPEAGVAQGPAHACACSFHEYHGHEHHGHAEDTLGGETPEGVSAADAEHDSHEHEACLCTYRPIVSAKQASRVMDADPAFSLSASGAGPAPARCSATAFTAPSAHSSPKTRLHLALGILLA